MTLTWHLVTGEYPPDPGGVSDYARQVVEGLRRAGDAVEVWAPERDGPASGPADPQVHRLRGGFSVQGLYRLGRRMSQAGSPARVLLQYTPHAFGWRAMNVGLPRAVSAGAPLWVMFHEVAWPRGEAQPLRRQLLAHVQERMASALVRRAERVFVSTSAWIPTLQRLGAGAIEVLPVPTNLPTEVGAGALERARASQRKERGERLIATFSSYDPWVLDGLSGIVPRVLRGFPDRRLVLIGRRAELACDRIARVAPEVRDQLRVAGEQSAEDVAALLCVSDVVLQFYADGITTRRGTAMAALALGRPLVTNRGHLMEPFWDGPEGPALLGSGVEEVAARVDEVLRGLHPRAGERGRQWYARHASLEATIAKLREPAR